MIWIKTMSASILPFKQVSQPLETKVPRVPAMQRTKGTGRVGFKAAQHEGLPPTLQELYQEGAAKIRLPKVYDDMAEAALINTSGGVTGGDVLNWHVNLQTGAKAVLTTQACEKIYKSSEGTAQITNTLNVKDDAELHWLPQETILFNEASLSRTLQVDLAPSARFLAVEAVILGRQAMGETVERAYFKDTWRVRKAGKLIHADDVLLNGGLGTRAKNTAVLNGARAFASILYIGPDEEDLLKARAQNLQKLQDPKQVVLSAFRGKLVGRVMAQDGYTLRQTLIPLLQSLRLGRELPKLWNL